MLLLAVLMPGTEDTELGKIRNERRKMMEEALVEFFPLLALQPTVGLYFVALYRAIASSCTRFLDHTQRRATVGRTPLDE
jgi:hypothetical protein